MSFKRLISVLKSEKTCLTESHYDNCLVLTYYVTLQSCKTYISTQVSGSLNFMNFMDLYET